MLQNRLLNIALKPKFAPDKKKIFDLIDLQNNKIVNIIKSNLSGATNVLVLSANSYHDKELLKDLEIGKLFMVDVGREHCRSKVWRRSA